MAVSAQGKRTVIWLGFTICIVFFIVLAIITVVDGFWQPAGDQGVVPGIHEDPVDTDAPYYQDYLIRRSASKTSPHSEEGFSSFLNQSSENRKTLTCLLPGQYYYPDGPVVGQGFNAKGEITVHILEGYEISNETMDEIEYAIRSELKTLGIADTHIVFYTDILPVLSIKRWGEEKTV
ncbi:MAG: hypothetical protein WC164_04620 [Patescibacteria group bacterium]|jgi:hypothetical protein|nr:hypothetical protein [Methanoregulaceae archaeon]HOP68080.1 hypothetical protein [Methanoregulaceae archaeon]